MKLEIDIADKAVKALETLAQNKNTNINDTAAELIEEALEGQEQKLAALKSHIAAAVHKGGSYSDDDVAAALLNDTDPPAPPS